MFEASSKKEIKKLDELRIRATNRFAETEAACDMGKMGFSVKQINVGGRESIVIFGHNDGDIHNVGFNKLSCTISNLKQLIAATTELIAYFEVKEEIKKYRSQTEDNKCTP